MFFEYWSDRYGWIIGALILMTAIALMIVRYRLARPPRMLHLAGLAVGVAIGGLLFIPEVPRLVIALRQLVIARAPTGTSGPFPVAAVEAALPSSTAGEPAIPVQIWYPVAGDPSAAVSRSGPSLCSKGEDHLRMAVSQKQFPILLYAPMNGGARDDNASTTAELASHGYFVMAIDDIDRDPRPSATADENMQPLTFDFSSAEAYNTTLRIGDRKVRREAKRALMALDRLKTCVNAKWSGQVRFDRVGFFGFSFGGSTAAEAGTMDPRVAAVANLDGSLFGRSAVGELNKPYMTFLVRDDVFSKPEILQSPDPNERYAAILTDHDLREEVRLANQPDGFAFRIPKSYHENLSDYIFSRGFFKTWLLVNPYRVKEIRDAYLLAFFDRYLRDMPSPLLTQSPSPFDEVEVLKGNGDWLDEAAKSSAQSKAESN